MTSPWAFSTRFRRNSFGWRSDTPIARIKEAVAEIKRASRKDAVLGADGAILFLSKLSPSLMSVDSSSGALRAVVNKAIEDLVPLIVRADVPRAQRERWVERLWQIMLDDEMPYLELLGDHFGALCVYPELASSWADRLLPGLRAAWSAGPGEQFYQWTAACLSALLAAGRHQDALDVLQLAPIVFWYYRRWGVKALVAMGKKAEALQYAEASRSPTSYCEDTAIALACEEILLSSGLQDEAYTRYALQANQANTYVARFRAIVKKYPSRPPIAILRDLINSMPGFEGKWFATARSAGFLDLALDLAQNYPADPKTLTRAARDSVETQPRFALAVGLISLRRIAEGHGYDITGAYVLDAYQAVVDAAAQAGVSLADVHADIRQIAEEVLPAGDFVAEILGRRLLH